MKDMPQIGFLKKKKNPISKKETVAQILSPTNLRLRTAKTAFEKNCPCTVNGEQTLTELGHGNLFAGAEGGSTSSQKRASQMEF